MLDRAVHDAQQIKHTVRRDLLAWSLSGAGRIFVGGVRKLADAWQMAKAEVTRAASLSLNAGMPHLGGSRLQGTRHDLRRLASGPRACQGDCRAPPITGRP